MVDAAGAIAAAAGVAMRAGNPIQLLHLAVLGVAAEAMAAADPTSTLLQLTPESDPAREKEVAAAPAEAMATIDQEEEAPIVQAVAQVELIDPVVGLVESIGQEELTVQAAGSIDPAALTDRAAGSIARVAVIDPAFCRDRKSTRLNSSH